MRCFLYKCKVLRSAESGMYLVQVFLSTPCLQNTYCETGFRVSPIHYFNAIYVYMVDVCVHSNPKSVYNILCYVSCSLSSPLRTKMALRIWKETKSKNIANCEKFIKSYWQSLKLPHREQDKQHNTIKGIL